MLLFHIVMAVVSGLPSMGWIAIIIYLVKISERHFSMMSIAVLTLVPANVPGAPDAGMPGHMTDTTRPGRCHRVAFSVDNSGDSDNQVGRAGVFDGTVLLYI